MCNTLSPAKRKKKPKKKKTRAPKNSRPQQMNNFFICNVCDEEMREIKQMRLGPKRISVNKERDKGQKRRERG
jgi:hypothetical protein